MNFADILIWLVVLVDLSLCITILLILCRVLRGISIIVNVQNPPPVVQPAAPAAPGIDDIQKKLDELEQERRKGEQQLTDLVGSINQFMTGGNDNVQ